MFEDQCGYLADQINEYLSKLKGEVMTDAKQEALKQALYYHTSHFGPISVMEESRSPKRPTPDQIVATAKKFEAFLDPNRSKK